MTPGARRQALRVVAIAAVVGGCGEDSVSPSTTDYLLWTVPWAGAVTHPAVIGDHVLFGTSDGAVVALDRHTGDTRWRRALSEGHRVRGARIETVDGLALAPHYQLWALDSETGTVRWSYGGPGEDGGTRTPAADEGVVYTASWSGWVAALDARTGEPLWTVDLGESAWTPALSADLVIYGTRGFRGSGDRQGPFGAGHLVALRRSDGTEAWRYPLPDSPDVPGSGGASHGGVVWGDRVIVGTHAARVHAVSLETGEVIWAAPNGEDPRSRWYETPPMVVDDVVILPRANHGIEGWDPETGERRWVVDVDRAGYLLASRDGLWYSFDGPLLIGDRNGAIRWSVGGVVSPLGDGVYYSRGGVSDDGIVYVLRGPTIGPGLPRIAALRPLLDP